MMLLFLLIFSLIYRLSDSHYSHQLEIDRHYMARAIELAEKGRGKTKPNPCVGCVILDENGSIVGEGWHRQAGGPHAEVVALQNAGTKSFNGTAYVSLEPCSHFGKTPPCSMALLRHGIRRVVAGMVDPDSRVSGRGLSFLQDHGVEVELIDGLEHQLCQEINAPFVHKKLKNIPYGVVCLGLEQLITDALSLGHIDVLKEDLQQLISFLLADVDTILLDFKQFLKFSQYFIDIFIPIIDLVFPPHVTIIIQSQINSGGSSTDIENIEEVLLKINQLEIQRLGNKPRHWIVCTTSTQENQIKAFQNLNNSTERHMKIINNYGSNITNAHNTSSCSIYYLDKETLSGLNKDFIGLIGERIGCNGVLLFPKDYNQLLDLESNGLIQQISACFQDNNGLQDLDSINKTRFSNLFTCDNLLSGENLENKEDSVGENVKHIFLKGFSRRWVSKYKNNENSVLFVESQNSSKLQKMSWHAIKSYLWVPVD